MLIKDGQNTPPKLKLYILRVTITYANLNKIHIRANKNSLLFTIKIKHLQKQHVVANRVLLPESFMEKI